jgi:CHAT domain-containing protein
MENAGPDPITGDEAEAQLRFISAAMQCSTREERAKPLGEGLVLFGGRLLYSLSYLRDRSGGQAVYQDLLDQAGELLGNWLAGDPLTDRADEGDRRALMAYELLNMGDQASGLKRLAAMAILKLPANHPLRNEPLAYKAVLDYLENAQGEDSISGQLTGYSTLLDFNLESEERLQERIEAGRALLDRLEDERDRRIFIIAVIGYYVRKAIEARDKGQGEQMHESVMRAKQYQELMETSQALSESDLGRLLLLGLVLQTSGEDDEAAEIYRQVRTAPGASARRRLLAAYHEGRLRVNLKQYAEALEVLVPIIGDFEEDYLTAVDEDEAHSAGSQFTKLMVNCAIAALKLGDWPAATGYIERSKSLRTRYRAALRQSPLGERFLELETLLYAASRGVPLSDGTAVEKSVDWLGGRVTAQSRLLEAYRELRAKLPPSALEPPSIAQIAATLATDEAAVLFAFESAATWLVVICRGDSEQPSWTWLDEGLSGERWGEILLGEREDGWAYAIGAPELDMDRPASLERLLAALDEAIGQPLNWWLAKRPEIQRLTLVPHRILHLVPLWALPALAGFEILMAPSAAHLVQARGAARPAGKHALVIGNPTLDLPLSAAEAESVSGSLEGLSLPIRALHGREATQTAVQGQLADCAVLHFCGHGISDGSNPDMSALLVHPELESTRLPAPAAGADPLEWAAAQVEEWQSVDEETRWGNLAGLGRIVEMRPETGTRWQRRFEYSPGGSLVGLYQGERLIKLAEMWTAGDIMGESSLAKTRLAFLSACESGGGALEFSLDEFSGLPAALQLAGVSSVVASLWPVSDVLTALYVDLFYEALAKAASPGHRKGINVPGLVHEVSTRLREMRREDVAGRLEQIRSRVRDARARFRLEAYAARIRQGEQFPFQHAYQWAAFYASGAPEISLEGE